MSSQAEIEKTRTELNRAFALFQKARPVMDETLQKLTEMITKLPPKDINRFITVFMLATKEIERTANQDPTKIHIYAGYFFAALNKLLEVIEHGG